MYEEFYGFDVDPFRLSPDHRFSFSHSTYAKAKAYIQYALRRAEGFVMVTGRPGTGKTTLVNEVLDSLSRTEVVVATLVSTQLAADDLLRMVAYSFGLDADTPHKALVLQRVMDFLVRQHRAGRRALLIIDEAQDLSISALEELRLLTNLQRDDRPLLQIVLLGQEALRDLVRGPSMEQVHQRLVAACDLAPLGIMDTRAYVRHRLQKAGWRGDPAIETGVWPILYRFSEGVPRKINLLCSRLFLHGCVEELHTLTGKDAAAVAAELQQEELAPRKSSLTAESLTAALSAGRQDGREGRERADEVREETIGPLGQNAGQPSIDHPGVGIDVDTALTMDDWLENGDIAGEQEFDTEALSALVGDARELSASRRPGLPDRASSPHGQRLFETSHNADAGADHRLPEESGSQHRGARDREPGELDALLDGLAPMESFPESFGSSAGARADEARAANGEVRPLANGSGSGARAGPGSRDEREGAGRAGHRWRNAFAVAVGLVILVGSAYYLRPDVLEAELDWLERRMAAIPGTAQALLEQLTAGGGNPDDAGPHPQPGTGRVESATARAEVSRNVAEGGGTAIRPAPEAGAVTGKAQETRIITAGPASPEPHPAPADGGEDRRLGPAEPADASRAIAE